MSTEPEKPQLDLGEELRGLGSRIESAIRTAVESDRARHLRDELVENTRDFGQRVESLLTRVVEDERVRTLTERGQQTIERVSESEPVQELQHHLAEGINLLNQQLDTLITRLQHQDAPPADDADDNRPSA